MKGVDIVLLQSTHVECLFGGGMPHEPARKDQKVSGG